MLCLVCKGLLSTRSGEEKGEGTLHLWYHVPYLFTVSGRSRDKQRQSGCLNSGSVSLYRGLFVRGRGLGCRVALANHRVHRKPLNKERLTV